MALSPLKLLSLIPALLQLLNAKLSMTSPDPLLKPTPGFRLLNFISPRPHNPVCPTPIILLRTPSFLMHATQRPSRTPPPASRTAFPSTVTSSASLSHTRTRPSCARGSSRGPVILRTQRARFRYPSAQ
ncbi:hypothetical protein EW145_g3342 [Phellinidium pouzarii]|uniref:Uncharacterized protein n=1 Tax=Phellinidium pouzarii TaxID=167371 RepID=A0A4S4LCT6_9AGAM|nr:hypothetical protein EW145_g3342 [Phellinidium pouzarii]